MADINSVIVKITDALNEAYAVAGTPSLADQLAAAQAQVTQLSSDKAALQAKIDAAKAAMAQADTADVTEDAARKAALDALA